MLEHRRGSASILTSYSTFLDPPFLLLANYFTFFLTFPYWVAVASIPQIDLESKSNATSSYFRAQVFPTFRLEYFPLPWAPFPLEGVSFVKGVV